MLHLSDKDFKATMIKANRNTSKTNKDNRSTQQKIESQQRNTRYKEKLNGKFRTKKITKIEIKSPVDGLKSRIEGIRTKSMNLKTEQ